MLKTKPTLNFIPKRTIIPFPVELTAYLKLWPDNLMYFGIYEYYKLKQNVKKRRY